MLTRFIPSIVLFAGSVQVGIYGWLTYHSEGHFSGARPYAAAAIILSTMAVAEAAKTAIKVKGK